MKSKTVSTNRLNEIRSAGRFHGLTDCQVDFCVLVEKEIGFEGLEVLEVGGNLPKDFVTNILGVNSWLAIEEPDYWQSSLNKHESIPIPKSHKTVSSFHEFQQTHFDKYLVVTDGIENFPDLLFQKFDLVFSVAALQHILRIGPSLFSMYHALCPNGWVAAQVAPIWTASNGHLLRSIVDGIGREISPSSELVPPWSHLVWGRPEFYVEMCKRMDRRSAGEIVFEVFDSQRINRLFFEDYLAYFRSSPFSGKFTVVKHKNPSMPDGLQKHLSIQFPGLREFNVSGFSMFLKRE